MEEKSECGDERPTHNLLFGKDPGNEAPTYNEAQALRAKFLESCQRVAGLLQRADALLVGAGAGFSADSGLAVYKDVANVKAYHDRGLSYYDLCQSHWVRDDPSTYYGFWGHCLRTYRAAKPHAGYQILKDWARGVESSLQQRAFVKEFQEGNLKPYFAYTSNVDDHFRRTGSFGEQFFDFHGNIEEWCCSGSAWEGLTLNPCSQTIYPVPAEFCFEVDDATMLAPSTVGAEGDVPAATAALESSDRGCPFAAAHRRGDVNRPRCPGCGSLLRPRIQFFGDGKFFEDAKRHQAYEDWLDVIARCIPQDDAAAESETGSGNVDHAVNLPDSFLLVMIEIGCGLNVSTVRHKFHGLLETYPKNAVLVRVNPDFPLVLETEDVQRVEVMSGGLEFLQAVDRYLPKQEALPMPGADISKPQGKAPSAGKAPALAKGATAKVRAKSTSKGKATPKK